MVVFKGFYFHSLIQPISIAPLQIHYYSVVLPTQHVGVSLRSATGKGLSQGPYVVARAGFEPKTLWMKGNESTNEPPCPMNYFDVLMCLALWESATLCPIKLASLFFDLV